MNTHAETHFGNRNAEAEALDALDALLADLGVPNEPIEEIVEDVLYEHTIEAAVPVSEDEAHEAEAERLLAEEELVKTTEDAKAVKQAEREAAKIKRDAEKVAKKIERETLRAVKKAEREAKKADKPTRKHYASKEERLTDKLGDKLSGFLVLTSSDAKLVGDELAAKQAETIEVLKGAGLKVQNRMTMLLEYVAGKNTNGLNKAILRAIGLLKRDGHIKTGDKGNFHLDLIANPYSVAAARAMGNNTVAALRNLQMIAKAEDGTYVPNPESLVLTKVNKMLGF